VAGIGGLFLPSYVDPDPVSERGDPEAAPLVPPLLRLLFVKGEGLLLRGVLPEKYRGGGRKDGETRVQIRPDLEGGREKRVSAVSPRAMEGERGGKKSAMRKTLVIRNFFMRRYPGVSFFLPEL